MWEIILKHPKVFVGAVDAIKKELGNINIEHLEEELSTEEIKGFLKRVNNVSNRMNEVLLDYDPNTENY